MKYYLQFMLDIIKLWTSTVYVLYMNVYLSAGCHVLLQDQIFSMSNMVSDTYSGVKCRIAKKNKKKT